MIPHVLILGGTGEARRLAQCLAARGDCRVTTALAGRTSAPERPPGALRIGGFGGAEGLERHLRAEGVAVLIDATHPFAARIAANAVEASRRAGVPLVVLKRPPWRPVAGDDWRAAAGMAEAVRLIGAAPRRVFLAIGRQEAGLFAAAPQHHYVVRSVEPVEAAHLPPQAQCILARGPFSEADEAALLERHRCEVIVAKNSGGAATYGKIAAARALGLPVIMVERPGTAPRKAAASVDEALSQVARHVEALAAARGA